jgi:hypothetical protein
MIAIVGDSFCADFDTKMMPVHRHHQTYTTSRSWVTDTIRHFGCKVDVHGYGGKSWWYSWSKFQECWHQRWHELTAIVFCHTSTNRINTCNPVFDPDNHGNFLISKDQQQNIIDIFYKYIHDDQFQQFAQEQYALMLREKFSNIKTLHFFTVTPLPSMVSTLPGTVFTTPLLQVAVAGLKGSILEISQQINDQGPARLVNHLIPDNNLALYNLVIESLENYQPGIKQIDMSNFTVHNTNYARWPKQD